MAERAQLPNIGVQQQHISFSNVTMESDKYIVVRETGATNTVVIVDMASPLTPLKRPITADSALMNPNSKIIALKAANPGGVAGDNLQIFNLDAKAKLKSVQFAEQVVFWKWITGTKLGLVTGTAVYHWDMNVSPRRNVLCVMRGAVPCALSPPACPPCTAASCIMEPTCTACVPCSLGTSERLPVLGPGADAATRVCLGY